jgi:2-succinyl-5-enolpyruvyl-6-hydroxy-3-cyclohexene-1-carboxylate synthase
MKQHSYPSIPLAQTVVRLCERYGIERVVICAGSRNAPLTNGFVNHTFFKTYSVVDERAAAFFALGIAQQLKKPVAIVCTSGSALLNFYPAIAEAYYSDIPLVVFSADRMPHRIDIGDGQTIRQTGVFEPHLEAAAVLKPDVIHATATILENPMQKLLPKKASKRDVEDIQKEHQQHNEEEIARVLQQSILDQGPVHLNIPMEEPLYGMTDQLIPLAESKPNITASYPIPNDFDKLKNLWHRAAKKWVIIGQQAPGELSQDLIDQLCEDPTVVVFTETTSNISHPRLIHSIDTLMAPLEQSEGRFDEQIAPELLLSFGGMVVSKKIKFSLRKYRPQNHWHVDVKKAYNTYYCLDRFIKTKPQQFLEALYSKPFKKSNSPFQAEVLKIYNDFKSQGLDYLSKLPFSDLSVFQFLSQNLPSSIQIQLANSSSIRYSQLFDWARDIEFYCNRGTSGIDGSTATAVGAAQVNQLPTVLITGDLSFFYDVNGLWNEAIPNNFKIILINNQGGGIFRILPGTKDTPDYDRYFETIHTRDAKYIAKAFNLGIPKVKLPERIKTKVFQIFKSQPQTPDFGNPNTPKTKRQRLIGLF